jgi:phosphoenolpyruvate synthase/pyruvate phosphate dikinase
MRQVTLEAEAKQVMAEEQVEIDYKFGTMIEVARAALTADQIAEFAQFFSFGTNDLTQTTYGISRDDAERGFLLAYVERKILPANPFQVLDRVGVGKLMKMAVELGVHLYACSTSMEMMGVRKEDLTEGVTVLGAAGFLNIAADSDMQFFIG